MSSTTPLPPSGGGHSRETAQWSHALTSDPSQPSYIVNAILEPFHNWRRCTKAEAVFYGNTGYQVWNSAGDKATFAAKEPDPKAAFAAQRRKIEDCERDLEAAGVSATHDDGLMEGESAEWKKVISADILLDAPAPGESHKGISDKDFSALERSTSSVVSSAAAPKSPRRSGSGLAGAPCFTEKSESLRC